MSAAVRIGVLVLLCAQNSAYTLLRRYSRGVLHESASSSSVLLAAEALKFCLAGILMTRPDGMPKGPTRDYFGERLEISVFVLRNSLPMAVPALTYLVMNMLSFKAMELVDATVFTMIAQLKIMTTAVFCWCVLGRRLSWPQWRAIILLTLAVSIITYQRGAAASHGDGAASGTANRSAIEFLLGVGMTFAEINLSGWISAYFEKYLKNGEFTVWARNLQLAMWSIIVYGMIEIIRMLVTIDDQDSAKATPAPRATPEGVHSVLATPLVGGWSIITFALVLLGGGGGILVAFAIKFADAVMKSMSTAFALVVVVTAEIVFLGAPADPVVMLAGGIAIFAMQYYSEAPKAPELTKSVTPVANGAAATYGRLNVDPETPPAAETDSQPVSQSTDRPRRQSQA